MDKAFDPSAFEKRWTELWLDRQLFRADPSAGKPPFSIVIPPPNITGRLHVGHGLNNTLIDSLVRWQRMKGRDALYLPGTDHASIATHVMIEREMEKEGLTRQDLGREKFLERAWEWNRHYGGTIRGQLKRLGASCDWSRERFTLDPGLSRAVREVFVRLYREGLIYRGRYMINWCPRCHTAVSDLEVVHRETEGSLWTIAYPLEGGGEIRVATTRPETILGDAAVAVNPGDARHARSVGRTAILPVLGRRIPVIADDFVDPAFGTGAVKITPAHDPADFEAGRRHGLTPIQVLDDSARMTAEAGPYAGMDRFECRAKLLERLKSEGLLVETKPHVSQVGHCDRCGSIVEPSISLQWFVRIEPLAAPALAAVEEGRIRFVPEQWTKTYQEWMRNIHDWCISRQLWWGHRIPAWYCDGCDGITVAIEDPSACEHCGGSALHQDPDILDTWFSSSLWPFSTLGWPDETEDLRAYYPTSILVTGYDIIFFWVARMIMMGLKFMGEVPFRTVFFTGLVRDGQGQKMSKTKGNAVDVLEAIDEFGADSIRFTFTALSVPGADIPFGAERVLGYRAFCNKIWNAARFARAHLPDDGPAPPVPPRESLTLADRWILSALDRATDDVDRALGEFRFDEAANRLYHFTWHEYCDWYLEMAKISLNGTEPEGTRAVLATTLDAILRLLHPIVPFVTEEIRSHLPGAPESLVTGPYPESDPARRDEEAERQVAFLTELVGGVRNARVALGVPPSARLDAEILSGPEERGTLVDPTIEYLKRLARLGSVRHVDSRPEGAAPAAIVSRVEVFLSGAAGSEEADRSRLEKELARLHREMEPWERKLANAQFVEKAAPEVVEKARRIRRELSEKIDRIRESLEA
ncbi:MAG TPA: valine--tRNA ligase [Candidatus Saccharimonadales bacterium]|nr:valine--tRNA ligase [Candidatus Saccharimonadales bacterium]